MCWDFQWEEIITELPALRDIIKENIKLRFFNSTVWPKGNILERKSATGFFKISSPALTFADLLENQNNLGGINRMLAILKELCESITDQDLSELLTWKKNEKTNSSEVIWKHSSDQELSMIRIRHSYGWQEFWLINRQMINLSSNPHPHLNHTISHYIHH